MNYLEKSKKEIIAIANEMATNVIDGGRVNILNEYLEVKSKIDYYTAYLAGIHEQAMTEFEEYQEKETDKYGRKITKSETGVKYDYSKCGHPDIIKYQESMKRDKKHLDAICATVKTLQGKTVIVDDETGETFEVMPPIKTSTTKLKITY